MLLSKPSFAFVSKSLTLFIYFESVFWPVEPKSGTGIRSLKILNIFSSSAHELKYQAKKIHHPETVEGLERFPYTAQEES
jgi:hypothetical protein